MNETKCREIVSARSHGICERCGTARADSKHHRVKRRIGKWEPSNIVDLCGTGTTGCHGFVENPAAFGADPDAAHAEGWALRSDEDPRAVSVAHRMLPGMMMFLDDEGGLITDPFHDAPSSAPEWRSPELRRIMEEREELRRQGWERTPEALRDLTAADFNEIAEERRRDEGGDRGRF
jgi:hypothetical protein